jgi:arsenite-transporting ATPase
MRLQDPDYTRIVLVTLPEVTPVSEAAGLQDDLRRARIEPFAWVVNRSLAASGTRDPVLAARLAGEAAQLGRVTGGLAKRVYVVPWVPHPPVGVAALQDLAGTRDSDSARA